VTAAGRWLFADQLGPHFLGSPDQQVLLVESTNVLRRRRFHRQKAHYVLSGLRHRARELGDRATYVLAPTYGEVVRSYAALEVTGLGLSALVFTDVSERVLKSRTALGHNPTDCRLAAGALSEMAQAAVVTRQCSDVQESGLSSSSTWRMPSSLATVM